MSLFWQCGFKNLSVSTDSGKTWTAIEGKQGGFGCLVAFADSKTGWFGFNDKFEMTEDGGATWNPLTLPEGVSKVAAMQTADGGKTWNEESQPVNLFGAPYPSRDGRFVTVNQWNVGTTVLKYE